jgi:NOL1/NOP2/sun family putative RNA methylase
MKLTKMFCQRLFRQLEKFFIHGSTILLLMSGKEFFKERYGRLGWKFEDVKPRQAIRLNVTNIKGKNLEKRLESIGVQMEKVPFLETGYWVRDSKFSVGATAEYLLGFYSIQESAAQLPVTLFANLKGKTVLDACAAPGGKTIQLVDLMGNTGIIVALDAKKRRLAALANHLERCHIGNTVVYEFDARQISRLKTKFDRILVDAPCSGNFVTDRQWFNRRTLKDVKQNAKMQREILTETAACLCDEGELVYSTCSLEPEENELNMDWAVKHLNLKIEEVNCYGENGLTEVFGSGLDSSVERSKRIWPGETQGFFLCKLTKKEGKR